MFATRSNQATALQVPASRPEPVDPGVFQPRPDLPETSSRWTFEDIVPMIATVLLMAMVVALLVLYISEYAHITQHGYTQQKLRQELQQERSGVAALRAEVEGLKQQKRIVKGALAQGLVPLTQGQPLPVPPSLLKDWE